MNLDDIDMKLSAEGSQLDTSEVLSLFLVAPKRLYKSVCPSVGPSVRRSVRNAFGHAFTFRPSRSDRCCVYGLVIFIFIFYFYSF